jgi:hypothetical protein
MTKPSENSQSNQPLGLPLNDQLGATLAACRPVFDSLAASMRGVSVAARAFADAWYATAEREYLVCHRRLPGSKRTERLRKKRRAVVLAWWARYCGFYGA